MNSSLYKQLHENYETMLKYYELTKEKYLEHYEYICKYRENTKEYCNKMKELFKAWNNSSDMAEYKTIEINFELNNKDNKNNKNNKNNKKALSLGQNYEKKVKISPIQNSANKISIFFQEFINCLDLFMDSFLFPLTDFNKYIGKTDIEINSINNNYFDQQKEFLNGYKNFNILNKDLTKLYEEAESKLLEFCYEKKKKKKDLVKFEENLNNSISEMIKKERNILDKYSSINNIGEIFTNSTNENINAIKLFTSSLLQKCEMCSKSIFGFFQKSFLLPMDQFLKGRIESNIENEIKTKKELEEILNSYTNNIEEKDKNIALDEYKIKVTKNNIVDLDSILEDRIILNNIMEEFSFEPIRNENKNEIEEEEIYYVAKNMYDKFKLINKSEYNLKIEEQNLKIKKTLDKLTAFAYEKNKKLARNKNKDKNKSDKNDKKKKKDNNKNTINETDNKNDEDEQKVNPIDKEVTQEEIDDLCKLMKEYEYRKYVLFKINNFRTQGAYSIPLQMFNYLKQIFLEISKYIYTENKENNELILDIKITKLVIILSQTFYCMKDNEKVYLQKEISEEQIFHNAKFWEKLIKSLIDSEIQSVQESAKKNKMSQSEEKIKKRIDTIAFTQILPNITGMNGFGLKKEEIENIILLLVDEYKVSQSNKDVILGLLNTL